MDRRDLIRRLAAIGLVAAAGDLRDARASVTTTGAGKKPTGGGSATTFNPAKKSAGVALSGGNLTATGSVSNDMVTSIGSITSGKARFEFTPTICTGTVISLGVCNSSKPVGPSGSSWVGGDANSSGWYNNGDSYEVGTGTEGLSLEHYGVGITAAVEIDFGGGLAYFMIATDRSRGFALPTGAAIFAYVGLDGTNAAGTANFGPTWAITPSDPSFDHMLV